MHVNERFFYWGISTGFTREADRFILDNQAQVTIKGIPTKASGSPYDYTVTVREYFDLTGGDPSTGVLKHNIIGSLPALDSHEFTVSFDLPNTDFAAGSLYSLEVMLTDTDLSSNVRGVQVIFEVQKRSIISIGSLIQQFFSAAYTLSGTAIDQVTNKIVDQASLITSVGTSAADYITDGVDDDVQINAAYDFVNANNPNAGNSKGGSILIKEGTYSVTNPVIIDVEDSLIKSTDNRNNTIIEVTDSSVFDVSQFKSTIKGFSIVGQATTATTLSRYTKSPIDYNNKLSNVSNSSFIDLTSGSTGVVIENGTNEIKIDNFDVLNSDIGFFVESQFEGKIHNSTIRSSLYGIVTQATNETAVNYLYIDNFYFEAGNDDCECAIYVERGIGWANNIEIVGKNRINKGVYIRDSFDPHFSTWNNLRIEAKEGLRLDLLPAGTFTNGNVIQHTSFNGDYIGVSSGNAIIVDGDSTDLSRISNIVFCDIRRIHTGGEDEVGNPITASDLVVIRNSERIKMESLSFYGFGKATNNNSLTNIKLERVQSSTITDSFFGVPSGIALGKNCITIDSNCQDILISGNNFEDGFITQIGGTLSIASITSPSLGLRTYSFSGSPDLSEVEAGMALSVSGATAPNNNGLFTITSVDNTAKTITVTNPVAGTDQPGAAGTATVKNYPIRIESGASNIIIKDNIGFKTEAYGQTTVTSGNSLSEILVDIDVDLADCHITVTPIDYVGDEYRVGLSRRDRFLIQFSSPVASNKRFDWKVERKTT